jgi:hypothetical protein
VARPRAGSRRYFVTLSAADAERLEAYAASVERRPTTVAAELLLAGLEAATGEAEGELAAARRRIAELERQLEAVFSAHRPPEPSPCRGPRWEWPMAELLADRAWWERWLPRLGELLGRDLPASANGRGTGLDVRGYVDILGHLLPPVGAVTWHSPDYPRAATESGLPPARAQVWEPVVRHVAVALCALERCAEEGADPQLRLDCAERITGPWVRVLRNLVGEGQVEQLPKLPL